MPSLSIITVNLNNLAGLKKTMQSVFEQTFTDYEYIIIDGGSTDGSKEYIEQHADKLAYWVSERDGGIFNAMNKGIIKAKGDYLIFMNSGDDFFDGKVIENVFRNDVKEDIIYGNVRWWPVEHCGVYPDVLTFEHFVNNTIPHQGAFIKRDLFDVVGLYEEQYRVNSDWNFFVLAVYKFNCSYRHLDITVANCNTDGISLTNEGSKETDKIRKGFIKHHFEAFYHELSNQKQLEIERDKFKAMLNYRLVKYALAIHDRAKKIKRRFYTR